MAPAGLSILTASFSSGGDRSRAPGVRGAISGLAAAAGASLGGVLSQGPGWRRVLFVSLPACALILSGACRLVPRGRPARSSGGHVPGAALGTGGMLLLLVCTLARAPGQGRGSTRTIGEPATAAAALAAFTAADATQMIAFAAFVSVFCFLTLDMQDVAGFSPIRSGSAYLPITAGIMVAAGTSSRLPAV